MGCEVEHCDEAATLLLTVRYQWVDGEAPTVVTVPLCKPCARRVAAWEAQPVTIGLEALT